jgi:hypothetical protein
VSSFGWGAAPWNARNPVESSDSRVTHSTTPFSSWQKEMKLKFKFSEGNCSLLDHLRQL